MSQARRIRAMLPSENVSKIDLNIIKKFKAEHVRETSAEQAAVYIDSMKVYQLIFSKRLASEITNGWLNLLHAISHPNATTDQMENALVKFL